MSFLGDPVEKDGKIIGWYSINKGMISVTSAQNYKSKTTRVSNGGSNEAFARLILSETWAHA